MNILLDENVPTKLKFDFDYRYNVSTVLSRGWSGKKNGELLKLMIESGIQVFMTLDQNLEYQQNLSNVPLLIILLIAKDSKHQTLQPLAPQIVKKLQNFTQNEVFRIEV